MDADEPFLFQQERRRPRPGPPPSLPPVVARHGTSAGNGATPSVARSVPEGSSLRFNAGATPAGSIGASKAGEAPLRHGGAGDAFVRDGEALWDDGIDTEGQQAKRGPKSYAKQGYGALLQECAVLYERVLADVDVMIERERLDEERKLRERKEAQARIAETLERNPLVSRAPKRVSYLPLVERTRIRARKLRETSVNALFIPRISISYADPAYNERLSDGETIYKQLFECFVSFNDAPTAFQHKIFTAVASACAPLIFGEEFFSDPSRCLQIIGARFTDGLVGILTGRKTGKSTGLSYVAICYMFVVKKFKSIIVSKTLEQAKIILDTVKGLIQSHPWWGKGFRVVESRATALVVQGPDGSLRMLEARCGSGEVRVSLSCLFFSPPR